MFLTVSQLLTFFFVSCFAADSGAPVDLFFFFLNIDKTPSPSGLDTISGSARVAAVDLA